MGRFIDELNSHVDLWVEQLPKWLLETGRLRATGDIIRSSDLKLIAELAKDFIIPCILHDDTLRKKEETEKFAHKANEAKKAIKEILFSALAHANPHHTVSEKTFESAFDKIYDCMFFGPVLEASDEKQFQELLAGLQKQQRSPESADIIKKQLQALRKDIDFTVTDDFARFLILMNEFRMCPRRMFDSAKALNPEKRYTDSDLLCIVASFRVTKPNFYAAVLAHPFCDATVVDVLLTNPECSTDFKERCKAAKAVFPFRANLLRRIDIEYRETRAANYTLGYGNAFREEDKLRDAISKSVTIAQIEKLIIDYCEKRPHTPLASHLAGVIEPEAAALAPK